MKPGRERREPPTIRVMNSAVIALRARRARPGGLLDKFAHSFGRAIMDKAAPAALARGEGGGCACAAAPQQHRQGGHIRPRHRARPT